MKRELRRARLQLAYSEKSQRIADARKLILNTQLAHVEILRTVRKVGVPEFVRMVHAGKTGINAKQFQAAFAYQLIGFSYDTAFYKALEQVFSADGYTYEIETLNAMSTADYAYFETNLGGVNDSCVEEPVAA